MTLDELETQTGTGPGTGAGPGTGTGPGPGVGVDVDTDLRSAMMLDELLLLALDFMEILELFLCHSSCHAHT